MLLSHSHDGAFVNSHYLTDALAVYVERRERIRIISARVTTRTERKLYEQA